MSRFPHVFATVISIVIGLMFLIGGLLFFLKYDPASYDKQATGTIVDIEERYETIGDDDQLVYDVYIDYTVEGKTFEHVEYFEYHTGMKKGDTVTFYYKSTDPSQIAGSDKDMAPYFGLAFAAVGLVMLVVTGIRIVRKKPA